ncbi:hypothetical protein BGZ99_001030, partial [Dissophora globulifera]
MTLLIGSKKEFERIKRHHEAFAANKWDMHVMEPALRVCMILNRFSRNLIIMYASSACERIFHIDPDHIVGKPVLLFIRADDLASFVEQMDMIKASPAVAYMRFWFQSPKLRQEVPCEVMLFGAVDGIVAAMQRCRPFVRKRFIESRDHYHTLTKAAAPAYKNKDRSQNSSLTLGSSASSSSSASSTASVLPMSKISRIRILDLERNSCGNSSGDDDDNSSNSGSRKIIEDGVNLVEGFDLKVYNVQDYVEEQDSDDDSGDNNDDCGFDSASKPDSRQEFDMGMN